ncbi:hypothetical protein ACFLQU_03780 [Verrucomicrobiota bacterium]
MKLTRILLALAIVLGVAAYFLAPVLPWHSHPPYIRDMSNLKNISTLCLASALDQDGQFPKDWSDLSPRDSYSPALFVTRKNRKRTGPMSEVMSWTDYVYVPGHTVTSPPHAVVAYLPPGVYRHQGKTGAVVAFASGEIHWLSVAEFTKAVNKGTPTKH